MAAKLPADWHNHEGYRAIFLAALTGITADLPAESQAKWNRAALAFVCTLSDAPSELKSALQEAREALVPDGWALVPIEPTEAMISAGANGTRNGARETAARTYASMLSAAEVYRALSPGGADE